MTYIIGRKLNNNPFLMIDCKVKNEKEEWYYLDKSSNFNSNIDETYFYQMGFYY
jgi:hypothetical protein